MLPVPVNVCGWPLTDSGFGAGEAAVFGHQVCVVALAGQNLQHLGHLLSPTVFGPSVHSEADICSVAGKQPPGVTKRDTKSIFQPKSQIRWYIFYLKVLLNDHHPVSKKESVFFFFFF